MDTYTLLIFGHIIGTILGVGGATFVEVFLNKALRDGQIDPTEGSFLKTMYMVVRIGLALSLITGFGFLLLYTVNGQTFKLYNPLLWAKITMVLVIALNAALLQMHKMSLYWGSALSFVTWYSTAIVGIFLTNAKKFSYIEIMVVYIICVIIGAIVLDCIRKMLQKSAQHI